MDGEDLREASHERAVEVIRKAGNRVTFLVQSLVDFVISYLFFPFKKRKKMSENVSTFFVFILLLNRNKIKMV